MYIRKSTIEDLNHILSVYEHARNYMKENNNPNQWKNSNPPIERVIKDIEEGLSYVCVEDRILGVFYFNEEIDPTYLKIEGRWLNNDDYGVIHRIAVIDNKRGIGTFCIKWVMEQCKNVRIDTHQDNLPMRNLLDKLGFKYCGIIELLNKEKRLAYQYIKENKDV